MACPVAKCNAALPTLLPPRRRSCRCTAIFCCGKSRKEKHCSNFPEMDRRSCGRDIALTPQDESLRVLGPEINRCGYVESNKPPFEFKSAVKMRLRYKSRCNKPACRPPRCYVY